MSKTTGINNQYDCDIISYYFDGVTPNPFPNSRHFDTALRNAEVSVVKKKREKGFGGKLHINTEFAKYTSLPKAAQTTRYTTENDY